jgi:hypothetical protein
MAAAPGATIPPLSLTGGTAGPSDGAASGSATSGTGDFIFKGSSTKDNATSWLQTLAPVAVAGVALWLVARR